MPGAQIFSDKKFFIVQRVPSRSHYIEQIERHGGRLVKLEPQADYVIADHLRKDAPYGSLSYKFIEEAIHKGEIPERSQSQVGQATAPTSSRPIGGLSAPGKSTRTPFTAEDDRVLYQHVKRYERQGGSVKGNEIYKELAEKNPRHTYQSWRDRYVKYLLNRPPAGVEVDDPPDTPAPVAQSRGQRTTATQRSYPSPHTSSDGEAVASASGRSRLPKGFSEEDMEVVLADAAAIEEIPFRNWDAAWEAWAQTHGRHSAKRWTDFYKDYARAEYLKRLKEGQQGSGQQDLERHNNQLDGAVSSRVARFDTDESVQRESVPVNASSVRSNKPSAVQAIQPTAVRKRPIADASTLPIKRQRVELPQSKRADPIPDSAPQPSRTPSANQFARQQQESGKVRSPPKPETRPIALTQENLAEMQSQHKKSRQSKQRRAVDLPVDEESQDQSGYVEFLEKLLPRMPQDQQNQLSRLRQSERHEEEIPESIVDVAEDNRGGSPVGLSSQELGSSPVLSRTKEPLPRGSSEADVEEETPGIARPKHKFRAPAEMNTTADTVRPSLGSRNAFATTSAFRLPCTQIASSPPVAPSRNVNGGPMEEVIATPLLQLDLPEPEGGFFNELSSHPSEQPRPSIEDEDEDEEILPQLDHRQGTFDTQAVYAAETQEFDFGFPDLDVPPRSRSPTSRRTSRRRSDYLRNDSRSVSPILSEGEDIHRYVGEKVEAGFKKRHVYEALEASCMQSHLAEVALDFLAKGKGLPKAISGIWTKEEDEVLQGTDGARIAALEKKHGPRELNRRMLFLEEMSG